MKTGNQLTIGQRVTIALFNRPTEGAGKRLKCAFGAKVTEVNTTHFRAEPTSPDLPRFDRDWFRIGGADLVSVIPHATA